MTSIYDMLRTLDPELQGAQVNLANTFDDRFVRKATG
jgi:NitT/TauT family transport system substrate-binding protein